MMKQSLEDVLVSEWLSFDILLLDFSIGYYKFDLLD